MGGILPTHEKGCRWGHNKNTFVLNTILLYYVVPIKERFGIDGVCFADTRAAEFSREVTQFASPGRVLFFFVQGGRGTGGVTVSACVGHGDVDCVLMLILISRLIDGRAV